MHWFDREQRHERARHHARLASQALAARHYGRALLQLAVTGSASPRMARDRLIYAWLTEKIVRLFERLFLERP